MLRSLNEYSKCEFFDYAPKVFAQIRKKKQIDDETYLTSLGIECLNSMVSGKMNFFKGLESSGKSGSFFFTTSDDKFFVKTIPEREFDAALMILKDYYKHFFQKERKRKDKKQRKILKSLLSP